MQRELELLVYASVVASVAGIFYFMAFHSPVVIIDSSAPVVASAPPQKVVFTVEEELPPPPPTRVHATATDERRRPVTIYSALDMQRLGGLNEDRRERTGDDDFHPIRPYRTEHFDGDFDLACVRSSLRGGYYCPSLRGARPISEIQAARALRTNDEEFSPPRPITIEHVLAELEHPVVSREERPPRQTH